MFGLGIAELLILLVLASSVLLPVWGLIDAASHPEEAFTAAGHNKTLWIVLNVGGLLLCGIGLVLTIVYFAAVRPKVVVAGNATA